MNMKNQKAEGKKEMGSLILAGVDGEGSYLQCDERREFTLVLGGEPIIALWNSHCNLANSSVSGEKSSGRGQVFVELQHIPALCSIIKI